VLESRLGDGPRVAEPAAIRLHPSGGHLLRLELGLFGDLTAGVAHGISTLTGKHVHPANLLGIAVEVLSCEERELVSESAAQKGVSHAEQDVAYPWS